MFDPEGVEKRAIHRLVNFEGKQVLECGCGDGRMTWLYAHEADRTLAFDPDEQAISTAREQTPRKLKSRVDFRIADMVNIDLVPGDFDIGIFSWSI